MVEGRDADDDKGREEGRKIRLEEGFLEGLVSRPKGSLWKVVYAEVLGFLPLWLVCRVSFFPIPFDLFSYQSLCRIGIVLAFTIPRVPAFSLNVQSPLVNATGAWAKSIPTVFSRAPANFTFAAYASLQADTTANFLPLNFKHLRAQIYDLDTNKLVGTGDWGHHTLPAKQFPKFLVPMNFTYVATNSSDQTCQSLISSFCLTSNVCVHRAQLVQFMQK